MYRNICRYTEIYELFGARKATRHQQARLQYAWYIMRMVISNHETRLRSRSIGYTQDLCCIRNLLYFFVLFAIMGNSIDFWVLENIRRGEFDRSFYQVVTLSSAKKNRRKFALANCRKRIWLARAIFRVRKKTTLSSWTSYFGKVT